MAKGAHKVRPDITEWYENELNRLYKQYRPEILEEGNALRVAADKKEE